MRCASIVATLALAGCATPPPLDIQSQCPPMVTYTLGDQLAFAAELKALDATGKYPHAVKFLGDYKAQRDATRACMASGKP